MTTANDEAQRIRSYLVTQANKLSIPDLVEKVRRDTLPLWDAAAAVPSDRFGERPGPEDWSAAEVLTHVLDMTEHGASAIEGIIAAGTVPPRIEDELRHQQRAGLVGAEDYRRVWSDRREQLYERVLRARGDEHLDVKITHSTFGPFSWREWLLFMRVHDLDHMRQLQAIGRQLDG
ncbi:MAG: DinB family protein [Dehalococcoidia bacterium]